MSSYSLREGAFKVSKFLKLVGYGTFSVVNNKVYVTAFDFACFVFNILIGSFVLYLSLQYSFNGLSKVSILISIGVIITMNGGAIASLTSTITVFCQRKRVWKVLTALDVTIDKFREIHVYPNFRGFFLFYAAFASTIMITILVGLAIMATWLGYAEKLGILLIYGYLSTTYSMLMAWTAMFHLAIFLRLRLVNETIR